MEKGKAREWAINPEGQWIEPWEPHWPPANESDEGTIHVREVIELTDEEKRRVEVIKNHITSNRLLSGEGQKFLLSLLERAGVC